ncbi:magnesium/cobalt transporter CorA [Aquimarina algicola]|uniref:Magnesium transport protein CorA n=1 Tax=Aquimarina algicola TaxID=2589995 RepID=A0A504JA54_9FLAO|nr:magnesium/cobalt transporter CorA [Aquimarina algicola]TPN84433.1 magnesium/cobalt transporter CorA [Aquimarina algicola]
MSRKSRVKKNIGLTPGTIVYTGNKTIEEINIDVFNYTKTEIEEINLNLIEDSFKHKKNTSVTWININGLNDTEALKNIGLHYSLHPLIMEDIANINQRPKLDEYEEYIFVVFKMLYYDKDKKLKIEHLSLILGDEYVISFQEAEGDVFDTIRERIRNNKGIIRSQGADYLLYALMDAIVDQYFLIIEALGEKIEYLEEQLFNNISAKDLPLEIQNLKKEILKIRRSILPLREVISKLEKINIQITSKTKDYLNDLLDHTLQVLENIEIYREMLWGLTEMYMTNINNKMNEVMKTLTIIATIFIPLTFIAGVYGMNFDHMPELRYKYSYHILWGVMIIIFFGLLYFFKRKKWL